MSSFISIRLNIQLNHLSIAVLSLQHERRQPLMDSVAARGRVLRQQGGRPRPKCSGAGGSGSEEVEGNALATGAADVKSQRSWYQQGGGTGQRRRQERELHRGSIRIEGGEG